MSEFAAHDGFRPDWFSIVFSIIFLRARRLRVALYENGMQGFPAMDSIPSGIDLLIYDDNII